MPTTTTASASPCKVVLLLGLALVALAISHSPALAQSDAGLAQPKHLIVGSSLPKAQNDAQILAARRYDTFRTTTTEAATINADLLVFFKG